MADEPHTTPDQPGTPDDILRREEPPLEADDTSPSESISLDEKLRQEEPPLHADDTSPSESIQLDERLAAEEPPLSDEDTSPSRATAYRQAGGLVPTARDGGRLLALAMLLGALILTGAAGYIWLATGDDSGEDVQTIVQSPDATNIAARPSPTTARDQPAPLETPAAPDVPAAPTRPPLQAPVLPTAAVDEIAVALLTPAPDEPAGRALQRDTEPFTIRPADSRSEVVQYVVQDGDTLESIAADFGLDDYYTLIWSNKTNKFNPLRPGNTLNIIPEDGVYHEVREPLTIRELAESYEVDPYTIIDAEYNNLFGSVPDTLLPEGLWVVVPGAEAERELFLAAAPTSSNSGAGASGVISGNYTLWGCTANVSGGTLPVGRPLSSYTWMRGFIPGGHTGVDLAPGSGQIGEPVFAAGSGTVVYAGWSDGGYGNVVVIAHGTTFSLYGHLNRASVSCNQKVSAGDVIGLVGSTGNSSGPHVHFEIRDANFSPRNPQNYVQF